MSFTLDLVHTAHSYPMDGAQSTHAQQFVSRRGEVGLTLVFRHASDSRLAQATHGLLPVEDLLDQLALALRDLVALMASRSPICPRSRTQSVKRHMRDSAGCDVTRQ